MGSICTQPIVQYDKKVVIVGASFAGLALAELLWNQFEVIIVDKNNYFEFICSGSKSLVSNEHFDSISLNYAQLLRANQNKAQFVQGTLAQIIPSENQILIQTLTSRDLERIQYDYLVICTGSQYDEPIKDDEIYNLDQRKSKLALEQEAIKMAQSILVVGAGPVGMEVLGELINLNNGLGEHSQKKKLALVSRSHSVLPRFSEKVQQYATEFLIRNNVDLYFGEEFDDRFEKQHQFDHVILCQGSHFKSVFMRSSEELKDCSNQKGQIFVNDHLQVTNVDPMHHSSLQKRKASLQTEVLDDEFSLISKPKIFQNVFCLGDACLTSANEEKTVYPLKQCAEVCANNIKYLAQNREQSQLQRIPERFDGIYSISLGPNDGMIIINNFVIYGQKAASMKISSQNNFMEALNGNISEKKKQSRDMTKLQCLLWMCNSRICMCCPCSNYQKSIKPVSESRKDKDL